MKRNYYEINENSAKTAHDMMSMSNYLMGNKTNSYRNSVNEVYDLAEKIIEKRPAEEDRLQSLADRYSKNLAKYYNEDSRIGCMCPSVMISGPANFPVRKKEKQNTAWEKNHEFYNKVESIKQKIISIYHGKEIIRSGDEDAIERLEEKLEGLKEFQEEMKSANKAIRLKDIEKGNAQLKDMGYTDKQIEELRKPDFAGRVGYPNYQLANNNANIHRIEGRIAELKRAKEKGTVDQECKHCKIVENTEIMRLQLFFDGKPEPEVRDILKSNGFKWAPSQEAWQRQLTTNAKYALKSVLKELDELEKAE